MTRSSPGASLAYFTSRFPFMVVAILAAAMELATSASAASGDAPLPAAASRMSADFALFELHKRNGRFAEAQAILDSLDRRLAPADPARVDLAIAHEGLEQSDAALSVWERFAAAGARLDNENLMKMAHLYEATGKKSKALDTWQAVWKKPLPAAQRSIVEDRILALASELGMLGDIAAELEVRHAAGRADSRDSSLLVRLYVRGQQQLSAVEAIEEYFTRRGADERQILKEQANVYRLLQDDAAYGRTMRRLIELDPAGRAEHLRALILHHVALGGRAHAQELRGLLAELRSAEGGDINSGFEPGVLALAGFLDEAIEAYRRGTVLAPEFPDNYLLLGDALKRRGRGAEATFLLQRLAAESAADPLFVAALDGLLNAQSSPEGAQPDAQATLFKWSQRIVLERIVLREDTLSLHSIFADVADASGDGLRSFAALDNSLPLAGPLRSALLRQLITLAAPDYNPDVGSVRLAIRDGLQHRIAYGRRLLALGDTLPPDVYMQISEDFLERGDTTGAARAFDRALEVSGRRSILGEAAALYDAAGYDELALRQYRRAFIADSTNVRVMLRFARLLERDGEREQAHALYTRGLQTLLQRQPALVPGVKAPIASGAATASLGYTASSGSTVNGEGVTREYTDNYDLLVLGLLGTWPRDATRAGEELDAFQHLLDDELTSLAPQDETPFAAHVRLDRLGRLIRRVAFATRHVELANRIDERLQARFAADTSLPRFLAQERSDWGLEKPDMQGKPRAMSLEDAIEEGVRTGSFDHARNLALVSADQDQLLAVARAWSKAGAYAPALQWASHGRLDAAHFRSLCRYAVQMLRRQEPIALGQLMNRYTSLLESVEATLGEPVFPDKQLLQQLEPTLSGTNAPAYVYISDTNAVYFLSHLSPRSRKILLDKIVSLKDKQAALELLLTLWRGAMSRPLAADLGTDLCDRIFALVREGPAANAPNLLATQVLLLAHLDPANVPLIQHAAQAWQASGGKIDYLGPLLLLKAGKTEEAIDAWLAVAADVEQIVQSGRDAPVDSVTVPLSALQEAFLPAHLDEVARRLDALEAQGGPRVELLQLRYLMLLMKWNDLSPQVLSFLERAAQLDPANPRWLANLHNAQIARQDFAKATDVIERLSRRDSRNPDVRVHLFADYLASDRPIDALKVNETSGEDMSAPNFLTAYGMRGGMNQPGALRGTPLAMPNLDVLVAPLSTPRTSPFLPAIEALRRHDAAAVGKGLRRAWQSASDAPFLQDVAPLASVNGSGGLYQFVLMTSLPADSAPPGSQASASDPDDALWQTLQGPQGQDRMLFDAATEYPASIGEYEDYLRAATPAQETDIYLLYGHLAKAYAVQGKAPEKLRELTREVATGNANVRDFTLWLAMLAGQAHPDLEAVALFERRLARPESLSAQQMFLMARIYAAAGMQARATETYRLIAASLLVGADAADTFNPLAGAQVYVSGSSVWQSVAPKMLLDESGRYLDRAGQTLVARDVSRLIEPAPQSPQGVREAYRRFADQVFSSGAGSGDPISAANELAAAGKSAEALELVRRALQKSDAAWEPGVSDESLMSQDPQEARIYGYYVDLTARSPMSLVLNGNGDLVPFGAGAAAPWLRTAADALTGWLSDPQLDPDRALSLLAIVVYRLNQAGDRDGVAREMQQVSKALAQPERYSRATLNLTLAVADGTGQPLELTAMRSLLDDGRLSSRRVAGVVERVAQNDGPTQALELGERIALHTQNDELLAILVALQKQVGNADRAAYWQATREAATQARQRLGIQPIELGVR